ncbi:hypothetical protein [Methylobacterium variabile]|uniref:hypothetical protein n=1 Tax=Methylobacterium variabile TaxID=298794 RepID=UPI0012EDE6C6|nr:hypothetical protein [Methylobacterium variabile]
MPVVRRAVVVRVGDHQSQVKGLMDRGLAGWGLRDGQSEQKGQDDGDAPHERTPPGDRIAAVAPR